MSEREERDKVIPLVFSVFLLAAAVVAFSQVQLNIAKSYHHGGHPNSSKQQPSKEPIWAAHSAQKSYPKATEYQQRGNTGPPDADPWTKLAFIGGIGVLIYLAQAIIMRQTLVHTNRAYVHVENMKPARKYAPNSSVVTGWEFAPVWKNVGGSPTRGLINSVTVLSFDASGIPDEFDFPECGTEVSLAKASALLLGPNLSVHGASTVLSIEQLAASQQGNCRIFMYGWAEYKDVFWFTSLRRTEFCCELICRGNPSSPTCEFDHIATHAHNGADGDCYRKAGGRARQLQPNQLPWPPPSAC